MKTTDKNCIYKISQPQITHVPLCDSRACLPEFSNLIFLRAIYPINVFSSMKIAPFVKKIVIFMTINAIIIIWTIL